MKTLGSAFIVIGLAFVCGGYFFLLFNRPDISEDAVEEGPKTGPYRDPNGEDKDASTPNQATTR
jgi:hypothetical protein